MYVFRISLIGVVALALIGPVHGDSLVSPEAKRKRDESDCRRRATAHTGFDPKNTESASETPPDPYEKAARLNPAPGVGAGAWGNAWAASVQREAERRNVEKARKDQRLQQEADLENQRAAYDRSFKVCLEGRNHSASKAANNDLDKNADLPGSGLPGSIGAADHTQDKQPPRGSPAHSTRTR